MSDADQLFEAIMEAVPDPVWLRDHEGRLITANAASLRLLGVDLSAARGSQAVQWRSEGVAAVWAAQDKHVLETGESLTFEEEVQTPAGTVWYLAVKVPWRDRFGRRGILGMARDITERKALERAEREAREQLIELQNGSRWVLIDAQERERERVKHLLESNLGAELSTLLSELDECAGVAPPELRERILSLRQNGEALMRALRRVSLGLYPEELEQHGLLNACARHALQWSQIFGVSLDLDIEELRDGVGQRCSKVIYRVIQEALTNVARHAGATRVFISATRASDVFELSIRDDGRGFGTGSLRSGLGLRSIRDRLRLLGGQARFENGERGGTLLCLQIPLARLVE